MTTKLQFEKPTVILVPADLKAIESGMEITIEDLEGRFFKVRKSTAEEILTIHRRQCSRTGIQSTMTLEQARSVANGGTIGDLK